MQKGMGGLGALISFGGMANVLKVRDHIASYEDPGWYRHPAGTMTRKASAEELKRDHVAV
jgi:hypothetical protein